MWTVPAHSFCAPTRAKVMAALRSMPGVWGVFGSSSVPGITRTPSCFQRSSVAMGIRLLSCRLKAARRRHEAGRGSEQKPGPERVVRIENKLVPPRQKRPARHLGNDPGILPEPCFLHHAALEDAVPAQDALDGDRLADRYFSPRMMHGQPRGNASPRG